MIFIKLGTFTYSPYMGGGGGVGGNRGGENVSLWMGTQFF